MDPELSKLLKKLRTEHTDALRSSAIRAMHRSGNAGIKALAAHDVLEIGEAVAPLNFTVRARSSLTPNSARPFISQTLNFTDEDGRSNVSMVLLYPNHRLVAVHPALSENLYWYITPENIDRLNTLYGAIQTVMNRWHRTYLRDVNDLPLVPTGNPQISAMEDTSSIAYVLRGSTFRVVRNPTNVTAVSQRPYYAGTFEFYADLPGTHSAHTANIHFYYPSVQMQLHVSHFHVYWSIGGATTMDVHRSQLLAVLQPILQNRTLIKSSSELPNINPYIVESALSKWGHLIV